MRAERDGYNLRILRNNRFFRVSEKYQIFLRRQPPSVLDEKAKLLLVILFESPLMGTIQRSGVTIEKPRIFLSTEVEHLRYRVRGSSLRVVEEEVWSVRKRRRIILAKLRSD